MKNHETLMSLMDTNQQLTPEDLNIYLPKTGRGKNTLSIVDTYLNSPTQNPTDDTLAMLLRLISIIDPPLTNNYKTGEQLQRMELTHKILTHHAAGEETLTTYANASNHGALKGISLEETSNFLINNNMKLPEYYIKIVEKISTKRIASDKLLTAALTIILTNGPLDKAEQYINQISNEKWTEKPRHSIYKATKDMYYDVQTPQPVNCAQQETILKLFTKISYAYDNQKTSIAAWIEMSFTKEFLQRIFGNNISHKLLIKMLETHLEEH